MSSATKAELAGLYIMAHEAVYIRIILEELGHKQPPTPHYRLTTQWRTLSSMVRYNPNEKKPWTSDFIGYKTVNVNNNSEYTGDPARSR
jgi:hypothetical protein